MKGFRTLLVAVLVSGLLLAACTPVEPAAPQTVVEVEAAEPTDTLPPPTEPPAPTDTPVPTATATPEPTNTPEPTPSPTPDLAATRAAEEAAAAAALAEEIRAELEALGVDASRGQLAWTNEAPVVASLNTYNTEDNRPFAESQEFSDFVLSADLTWESTGGLVICGFWLRGESFEQRAAHYLFQTIRLSGLPSWDVEYWKFADWVATVSGGGQVQSTQAIDQAQGSTNTFVLVADGSTMVVYANGTRLGQATVSSLSEGVLGAYIWQESGETTCTWDNIWIWDLSAE